MLETGKTEHMIWKSIFTLRSRVYEYNNIYQHSLALLLLDIKHTELCLLQAKSKHIGPDARIPLPLCNKKNSPAQSQNMIEMMPLCLYSTYVMPLCILYEIEEHTFCRYLIESEFIPREYPWGLVQIHN
jgi:hypothetical protein